MKYEYLSEAQIEVKAKAQQTIKTLKETIRQNFKTGDKFHFKPIESDHLFIGDTMTFIGIQHSNWLRIELVTYHRDLDKPFKNGNRKVRSMPMKRFLSMAVKDEN
jgi:hypothetical protein